MTKGATGALGPGGPFSVQVRPGTAANRLLLPSHDSGGNRHANIMYPGAGPIDTMINGRDGYLYIGTCGGTLVRLDPRTAQADYLGRPAPTRRMPGLVRWRGSLLLAPAATRKVDSCSPTIARPAPSRSWAHRGGGWDQTLPGPRSVRHGRRPPGLHCRDRCADPGGLSLAM